MPVKDRSAHELAEALGRLEERLRDAEDELHASRELAARFADRGSDAGELGRWLLSVLRDEDEVSPDDLVKYLDQSGPGFRAFITTVFELLGTRPLSED